MPSSKNHYSSDLELRLQQVLTQEGYSRVFIVTGPRIFKSVNGEGLVDKLAQRFEVETWTYKDKNATVQDAKSLIGRIKVFRPDVIVGLGGGVALDLAKIGSAEGHPNAAPLESQTEQEWSNKRTLKAPTILIPTIFGSGAESTYHAVIYNKNVKYSLEFIRSGTLKSFLVPSLSKSAPLEARLSAALDAVCQGVETAWSRSANNESRDLALSGLGDVIHGFDDYVAAKESDRVERFVNGANLIGHSMNTGKTTAPHAFSYYLTSQKGLAHGFAVALLLKPFWTHAISAKLSGPAGMLLVGTLDRISKLPNKVGVGNIDFLRWFDNVHQKYSIDSNVPKRFHELEVDNDEFLESVNLTRLAKHPIEIDKSEVIQILGI